MRFVRLEQLISPSAVWVALAWQISCHSSHRMTTDNIWLPELRNQRHFGHRILSTFTEKKVEPNWLHSGAVLENGATLEGGAIFFLNNHVSDLFLGENSSTFESGTKIVPQVELSYVPWNSSRDGSVLAPLFFSVLLYQVAILKQEDNELGSVCPPVCLSICQRAHRSCLNHFWQSPQV